MGKPDLAIQAQLVALAMAPGSAGEVAEAVHRNHGGFLERRGEEGRGQVGTVVLHEVQPGPDLGSREGCGQLLAQVSPFPLVAPAVDQEAGIRTVAEGVGQLAQAVRSRAGN